MAESIVIKKSYFNNIETAVNAINQFVQSNYTAKNFPMLDNTSNMDSSITRILGIMNSVEPDWISNPSALDGVIASVNEAAKGIDIGNRDEVNDLVSKDRSFTDKMQSIISFLQFKSMTDHFDEFEALLNGIYSFEVFTTPSKFRSELELFSRVQAPMIIAKLLENFATPIFSISEYVNGLFESPEIEFPSMLNPETEIRRISQYQPLSSDIQVITDQTVQEAADVNYFKDTKPQHIKYDAKNDKFVLSDQMKKKVNKIVSALEECDDSEDLREYFSSKDATDGPEMLTSNIMPFILAKVYNNKSKFPDEENLDVDDLGKYIKSYSSITEKNPGTKRFVNYDLFSTFKIDKEGTINFVRDFLTLNLVNSPNARISNNGLLSCFNIFDSRIYFDSLYNVMPKESKKGKYATEDGFVKFHRARINKNSRNSNVYAEDKAVTKPDNDVETTEEVKESAYITLKQMGDLTPTDMHLCEQFHRILYNELNSLDATIFTEGVSSIELGQEIFEEADGGKIPEYMQTRVKLSDEQPNVSFQSVPAGDIPMNPIPDLASSIDTKVNMSTDMDDLLGNSNPAVASAASGGNTYNITNNYYYNSFNKKKVSRNKVTNTTDNSTDKTINKDDHSTHDDHSSGANKSRTTNKVTKDSYNKHVNTHVDGEPFNNNNNSEDRYDTSNGPIYPPSNTPEGLDDENLQEFDSGIKVNDLFAFLEDGELTSQIGSLEEPLSSGNLTMEKPRSDLLTTAMDVDRNTLPLQQKAKRKVEKGIQTVDAITKPVRRTKQWLAGIIDSLVERNEDKVKAEIIENPSYRTSLFKAGRLALKLGLFGILFTINGYIAAAYAVMSVSKFADRERLKKEVQREFGAEMKILDDKIRLADQDNTPESRKAKWEMMRIRSKMEGIVSETPRALYKSSKTIV